MPANSPVVVSDASVLIFLAAAGQFRLLRDLYGRVFIPPQVFHEVAEARPNRPGDAELRTAITDGWVETKAPSPTPLDGWLRTQLNAGESEAIARQYLSVRRGRPMKGNAWAEALPGGCFAPVALHYRAVPEGAILGMVRPYSIQPSSAGFPTE